MLPDEADQQTRQEHEGKRGLAGRCGGHKVRPARLAVVAGAGGSHLRSNRAERRSRHRSVHIVRHSCGDVREVRKAHRWRVVAEHGVDVLEERIAHDPCWRTAPTDVELEERA